MKRRVIRHARALAVVSAVGASAVSYIAVSPAAASRMTTPTITSVTFSSGSSVGSSTPLVTINGSGFGNLPAPSPGTDPQSTFPGCGTTNGYDGLDFAGQLYFNKLDQPGAFQAGNGKSGNCIGLVIWEYTPTQIEYGFGSVYQGFSPGLQNGDSYSLHVKGATVTGTVSLTS